MGVEKPDELQPNVCFRVCLPQILAEVGTATSREQMHALDHVLPGVGLENPCAPESSACGGGRMKCFDVQNRDRLGMAPKVSEGDGVVANLEPSKPGAPEEK